MCLLCAPVAYVTALAIVCDESATADESSAWWPLSPHSACFVKQGPVAVGWAVPAAVCLLHSASSTSAPHCVPHHAGIRPRSQWRPGPAEEKHRSDTPVAQCRIVRRTHLSSRPWMETMGATELWIDRSAGDAFGRGSVTGPLSQVWRY